MPVGRKSGRARIIRQANVPSVSAADAAAAGRSAVARRRSQSHTAAAVAAARDSSGSGAIARPSRSARYAYRMADERKAARDAAAASAPMSGMGGMSLSFARRAADVHRSFRSCVRRQESRPGRLARRPVRRLPARGSAVADAAAARLRACGDPAGDHALHAARLRQLPVLAQPGGAVRMGARVRRDLHRAPAGSHLRLRHARAAGRQSLAARLRDPPARHADHHQRGGSRRPRPVEFDSRHAGGRVRDLRHRPRAVSSPDGAARSRWFDWSLEPGRISPRRLSRELVRPAASDSGGDRLVGSSRCGCS